MTASTTADIARWRANLQGEVDGAHVYRGMAANAGDARIAKVYAELAAAEERHADFWRERLAGAGASDGSARLPGPA